MSWFGPPRSRLGKWLDRRGIAQTEVAKKSGLPNSTISALARGESKKPTRLTARKLLKALREFDPTVSERDFWDL